jgi:hypothetical protein
MPNEIHIVLNDNHRVLPGKPAEQSDHDRRFLITQPGRRFFDQKQPGLSHKQRPNFESPPLSTTEVLRLNVNHALQPDGGCNSNNSLSAFGD